MLYSRYSADKRVLVLVGVGRIASSGSERPLIVFRASLSSSYGSFVREATKHFRGKGLELP